MLNDFNFDGLDFGIEEIYTSELDGYRKLDHNNRWFNIDGKPTIEFFDYLINKESPNLTLAYNLNKEYKILSGYRNSFINESHFIKLSTLFTFIKKHKDIENYFDEEGPTRKFIDYYIWEEDKISLNEKSIYLKKYLKLMSESEQTFFSIYHNSSASSKKILERFLTKHKDLENYFDKDGPKNTFYNLLYNDKQFEFIEELNLLYDIKIDKEKRFFSTIFNCFRQYKGVGDWLYREFNNKSKDEIWFDENGPTIKFIEHAKDNLIYKDSFIIMLGLSEHFLTNKNNIFIENEIDFFNVYTKMSDNFKMIFFHNIILKMTNSNELSEWINHNGPTIKIIDLLNKTYELQIISKEEYLKNLGILGEQSLTLEIYTPSEKGFINVYKNLSNDEKNKFISLCPRLQVNGLLDSYYSEDGPTQNLFNQFYLYMYTEPVIRKIVFLYDVDWKNNFTISQLRAIDLIEKFDGLSNCARRAASFVEEIPDIIEENISDTSKLEYLYSRNDEIFHTLNIKMLSNRMDVIDISFIEQFGIYSDIQERLLSLDDNTLKIFGKILKVLDKKEYDVTSIVFYILKNIYKYNELIKSVDYEKINSEELKNLITIISKEDNIFNICDMTELSNEKLDEKISQFYKKYDDIVNNNISLIEIKKILLEKKYGLTLSKAKFINKRYCHDIDSLENSDLQLSTINILKSIHNIVESESIDELKFLYLTSKTIKTDFYSTIALESSIRREYSKLFSDTLYIPREEHKLNENNELFNKNRKIYEKILNSTYDGHTPDFYVLDGEFNIQISALGAYSGWERPNNFKDDWLRPKIVNHSICTSYLGNNSLANARIKHAVYGFSNYESSSFMYAGNYDLSSLTTSNNYAASIMEPYAFYGPKDMINYTRHNHNEICLERRLNNEGENFKRLPSYVVYFVDDINNSRNFAPDNEVYQESLQAAIDFNIPIVIVDRLKYAKIEKNKCNELENIFMNTLDLDVLKELFLKCMTNCVGCRTYNDDEISEYQELFSDSTFKDLYERLFIYITSKDMIDEKRYELIKELYKLVYKEATINSSPYENYFSGKCYELENLMKKMENGIMCKNSIYDKLEYQNQIMNYFNQISSEEKEKIQNDIDNNISLEQIVNKINNNEYKGGKMI